MVAAARELFATEGYSATSLNAICDRAGTLHQTARRAAAR
ncbi:TetR family transcriptional regulator [Spirillospora sp. NPDC048819]